MAQTLEIRVPNIGDFADVPIVEVLVKAGDVVKLEDPLVAIESEKATMEVPSPHAGVVRSVTVKVGDKVSEGSALLIIDSEEGGDATATGISTAASSASSSAASPAVPAAAAHATSTAGASSESNVASDAPASPAPVVGGETTLVELRVPDIGDFKDIPVIDVLVAPGDVVAVEAPLVTLESEKAAMDVPASRGGTIREVKLNVGDRVSMGTLVATLEVAAAAAVVAPQRPASAPVAPAAPAAPVAAPQPPNPPTVAPPSHDDIPAIAVPSSYGASGHAAPNSANGIVHASPSIRRFSRELGVDLHAVRGSGPHGRITRDDVAGFIKTALARPATVAPAPSGTGTLPFDLPPWPKVDFAKFGPVEVVPLSRIRKLSGPNLHRNWVSIPHVTNNDEADITDLEAFRKALNVESPTAKVTMLAFVIKAVVVALRAHPDVNSSLDGENLVRKAYYNIGFAADTSQGLMVPVLHGADTKGVLEIATETAALAAKARTGKLGLAEMQGATFTISSLGGIGGTSFTPIINAPEVAILGVSRSAIRPVWDGTAFAPRLILPLSLSYDHRVIDGALAARFNATLASALGDLRRALL